MLTSGLTAKICGLSDPLAVSAAVDGRAQFVGFVFYPPSPRSLMPAAAGTLARLLPQSVYPVGVFFEPSDTELDSVIKNIPNVLIQLHGCESPKRVVDIKARLGAPIIKAISVATEDDLKTADKYKNIVDWLLFDSKAPVSKHKALPGGNGLAFDWSVLSDRKWKVPWLLSGGLTAGNLAEAVSSTRARAVDVSSGVEDARGRKDPERIREFLEVVHAI